MEVIQYKIAKRGHYLQTSKKKKKKKNKQAKYLYKAFTGFPGARVGLTYMILFPFSKKMGVIGYLT